MPEKPHMKTNNMHHIPKKLCRDQLNFLRPAPTWISRLLRHFLEPGHQMTIPEKVIKTREMPPAAFTGRPVFCESKRLSCRLAIQFTAFTGGLITAPISTPV